MTRKLTLALLSLILSTSLSAATHRYLVVPRSAAATMRPRIVANSADWEARRARVYENVGVMAMDLTEEEAAELRLSSDIESVELDVQVRALGFAAPPTSHAVYTKQVTPWGITAIHAPDVWAVTKGSPNVNVAVLDTGIDATHPDLVQAYAGGYNTIETVTTPLDDNGHGTHVAGTIAAANNAFGVVGVAPAVKVWSVKILARDGTGSFENVANGLNWVIEKKKAIGGSWVVNMSIGAQVGTQAGARAIQNSIDNGITLVAAAGNNGTEMLEYPAAYPGVISVGAIGSDLALAEFSTHGPRLSIVAPGVEVPSSVLRGTHVEADVSQAQQTFNAYRVDGSPLATVSGAFVECGFGRPEEIPGTVAGKIAVIKRGPFPVSPIPFYEKAQNAKKAGAVAVIIYNDDDNLRDDIYKWAMCGTAPGCPIGENPLTIGISNADGVKLLSRPQNHVTPSVRYEDYGILSGTSMATPHVTGTVALLLSLAPDANPATIEWAIRNTAVDVDETGWDIRTSWGMIDALAAAKLLAPGAFGGHSTPAPPARRRSSRP